MRVALALVVLLRHLHPPDTGLGANVGVKRATSKLLVLVELLNLTFDRELDVRRDSNVKFAPLVVLLRHLHPVCVGSKGKCRKQENHEDVYDSRGIFEQIHRLG